ncbi:MAG: leucyl/phenylalanyl-tRNA--protein transferase [Candidatus Hydrogenedentes bacterium]|nr:leucyl/phenylalanyl-tRNA--protein transferase [Candidatus Hydrogenedentota bacterium]
MPVFRLSQEIVFPPPDLAVREGLLAVGGDLSPARLLLAYRSGIFPWYDEGEPILWWSPDPRMVLLPAQFHVSRRLARTLRAFNVTWDTAFWEVIEACARAPRPGQDGTWIMPEMIEAYTRLHDLGYAHSVECRQDGRLVGGLYGVSLGRCFFGESMFHEVSDASKAALAALVQRAIEWGFGLIDCQVPNPHLVNLGAREIPRSKFLKLLEQCMDVPDRVGRWT